MQNLDKLKKVEILAPAGNIEALKFAVANGADAVYLGLELFNARIKADNFSTENIKFFVDFCHLRNVKVYLTLNTNVLNSEIELVKNFIKVCSTAQIDAFILADLGLIQLVKEIAPNIALHASTQMGVHNRYGALIAKNLGFSRIVLSREAQIEDIKDIKDNVDIEIEYFVHGALCVSFSGGCVFSSLTTGCSGNRGMCLQPCRKKYKCGRDEGYFLSTSDQCLIENLQELADAGVDSFKIEGRLKRAEYAGVVAKQYYNAKNNLPYDLEKMKSVFNRGNFTKGYSFDSTKDLMSIVTQNHLGVYVGKVVDVNNNFCDILTNKTIANGDGFKIFRNNTEVGGFQVGKAGRISSNIVRFYGKYDVAFGDLLNITTDTALLKSIVNEKKVEIEIEFVAKLNDYPTIKLYCREFCVSQAAENACEMSQNYKISKDEIADCITRLGDEFLVKNTIINVDDSLFLPKSMLNKLRRSATEKLINLLINKTNFVSKNVSFDYDFFHNITKPIVALDNLSMLSNKAVNVLYPNNYQSLIMELEQINLNNFDVYLRLPKIARVNDLVLIENILAKFVNINIYADNIYALQLAKNYNRKIIFGQGMNVFNNNVVKQFNLGNNYIVSPELSERQSAKLNGFIYALGRPMLMTLAHCPHQLLNNVNCSNCDYNQSTVVNKSDNDFMYKDDYGSYIIKRIKVAGCYFEVIYNKIININNKYYNENTYIKLIDSINKDFDINKKNLFLDIVNLSNDEINNLSNIENYFGLFIKGVK